MNTGDPGRQKICLLGANGQVGMEVCLLLSSWPKVEVVPVTRTDYGAALLRRFGLEVRLSGQSAPAMLSEALVGACLVTDFGWPHNAAGKLPRLRERIRRTMLAAPAGAPYVLISTQSVRRLDPAAPRFSIYGLSKGHVERFAVQEGRRQGRPVYVLRLGEVHGPFQGVSRGLVSEFRAERAIVPAMRSYSVFTYTVAEALVNIAAGREVPGTYLLYSEPRWRYAELHNYYSRWTGKPSEAIEEGVSSSGSSLTRRMLGALRACAGAELMRCKDVIEYWAARFAPERMGLARMHHHRKRAAAEVAGYLRGREWRPYGQKTELEGGSLRCLTDVRPFILEKNRGLWAMQSRLFLSGKAVGSGQTDQTDQTGATSL